MKHKYQLICRNCLTNFESYFHNDLCSDCYFKQYSHSNNKQSTILSKYQ